ncbi:MAG: hypothetical protein ACE5F2_01365 [Candidatus Paceibacteria bacterium]
MLISEFRCNLPVIEIVGDCEAYKRLGTLLKKKEDEKDFSFALALEKHSRFNRVDVFCLATDSKDICNFLICIDKKTVCVFSIPLEESVDMSTIILSYFLGGLDKLPGIEKMYDRCRGDCKRAQCCRVQFEEVLFKESLGAQEISASQPHKVGV